MHTLLKLLKRIFYVRGLKANVLFFDRRPGREEAWTERLWIYDLRTNKHLTLKTNPLGEGYLRDFLARLGSPTGGCR
jgi:type I restriction enzyme M protein